VYCETNCFLYKDALKFVPPFMYEFNLKLGWLNKALTWISPRVIVETVDELKLKLIPKAYMPTLIVL